MRLFIVLATLLSISWSSFASSTPALDLTDSGIGLLCVAIFILSYLVVMLEEKLNIRKSKPVLFAAGIIWALIGYQFTNMGQSELAREALEHNFLEYAELFLFLLVAMTYINAMEERRLFDALKAWMIGKGFKYKTLFWITGSLAFIISPIADNLTTALIMCTIVLKVAEQNKTFITLCCINIVVGANAGGAFSPFGDITTLMVWQTAKVSFSQFFDLIIPSMVNFLIPAIIMTFFLPKGKPDLVHELMNTKRGAKRIVILFILTISTAVGFHIAFDFPPVIGMMLGLAYLQLFGFYLRKTMPVYVAKKIIIAQACNDTTSLERYNNAIPFDIFQRISRAEWDTLLFFYGVVMSVGGLSLLGYLRILSLTMYSQWDPMWANISIGLLSAIVDNIPVMYAVLTMNPDMSLGHWLLVTLTAGVGGSLLSIGSAAGVALMGASKGNYTFIGHLKWSPVILLGYAASIAVHMLINQSLFL
jgi:NhaD family Na+/H+ antiporter